MKKNTWNDMLKPVVVLVVICVIASAGLAVTNQFTAPIIAEQQAAAANQAYLVVVPGADNFEEVTDFATTNVQAVMKATNGAGWAIKASAKGFGGDVPVVVGFDAEGNIVGIQFMENSETAGYGQKLVDGSAEGTAFAQQFIGLAGTQEIGKGVDALSGATVSSKAAVAAINTAVNCFNEVALGQAAVIEEETPQMTLEEALAELAGGAPTAIDTPEGLDAAYQNGGVTVLVGSGTGYTHDGYGTPEPLTVAVAFDETGAITGMWVDVSHQTPGIGDQAGSEDFLGQFTGVADEAGLDGVDTIAGATETTVGVKKVVRKCVQAMAAMNPTAGGEGGPVPGGDTSAPASAPENGQETSQPADTSGASSAPAAS